MFVVVISNSLYILSYLQVVVNNFFIFLCCRSFAATLISYHDRFRLSTTFLQDPLFFKRATDNTEETVPARAFQAGTTPLFFQGQGLAHRLGVAHIELQVPRRGPQRFERP